MIKALVFERPSTGSEHTSVEEIPIPSPRTGQVLIRVEYAGINYIDVMSCRGDPGYASRWPYVPGLEVAGTVIAAGSADSRHHVGDRVAAFTGGGGLAEQVLVDDSLAVPLPAGLDGAAAAAAPLMLSTALLLLQDSGKFAAGDTVLMHSAGGGVGSAVAQLSEALGGGTLIGTVSTADKAPAAKRAGWAHVFMRDDLLGANIEQTAPGGVRLVLDPLGTRMLDFDLEHTAPGGRIVLFGNPGGEALGGLPPAGRLIGGNLAVGGFSISRLASAAPDRVARAVRDVLDLLSIGRVQLPVTTIDGLDGVATTHDLLASGRGVGKYVVAVP